MVRLVRANLGIKIGRKTAIGLYANTPQHVSVFSVCGFCGSIIMLYLSIIVTVVCWDDYNDIRNVTIRLIERRRNQMGFWRLRIPQSVDLRVGLRCGWQPESNNKKKAPRLLIASHYCRRANIFATDNRDLNPQEHVRNQYVVLAWLCIFAFTVSQSLIVIASRGNL